MQSPKLNDVSLGFTGVLDINIPVGFIDGRNVLTFSLSTRALHYEDTWKSGLVSLFNPVREC
jgi:hypothetical protein